ncbi:sigma-70 family RNA polymerase sigma factor [Caulobacter sp.]|uniref:sigma-70 family RNA polymerase sigma factor n=1 Tax=Caulobacter sp. TaxID=78 RepID=UPI0016098A2F
MVAQPKLDPREQAFFERLSVAYRGPLIAYFQRRVRSREEAEDLTQEVFLRLVRRPEGADLDNPEAFVFSAAVNLLRDRMRRDKTFRSHLNETEHRQERFEGISPERVLQDRQALQTVMRRLDELDERTRDAFILHRLEGWKHAEIARAFGVSVSSVEKYIIKALAHLMRSPGPYKS